MKQKNVVEISGRGQRGAPKTEFEQKKVVEISDPGQRGAPEIELEQKKRSCQIFVGRPPHFDPPDPPSSFLSNLALVQGI